MITESHTSVCDTEFNSTAQTKTREYIKKLRELGAMRQYVVIPQFDIRVSTKCYLRYNSQDNMAIFFLSADFDYLPSAAQTKVFGDLFVELLSFLYYGNNHTVNRVFIRSILRKDKL